MSNLTIDSIVFAPSGSISRPLGLLDGLSKEQGVFYSGLKSQSSGYAALEMGHNRRNIQDCFIGAGDVAACEQRNANDAIQEGQGRRTVEIDDGKWRGRQSNIFISELNRTKFWACHRYILSLKARLGLSCRAFVNAWRFS